MSQEKQSEYFNYQNHSLQNNENILKCENIKHFLWHRTGRTNIQDYTKIHGKNKINILKQTSPEHQLQSGCSSSPTSSSSPLECFCAFLIYLNGEKRKHKTWWMPSWYWEKKSLELRKILIGKCFMAKKASWLYRVS